MRACRSVSRFALSSSVVAISAAACATPAFAQQEQTQVQAQQTNATVACSTIADPAKRQTCVNTQGTNATPTSGAPSQEEITVTGSRIKRPNFETLEPAVVINSAAIEQRGFQTVADALNEQPTFGVPGSSPVGAAQGGAFGSGQNFVNFLGLGSQRTLVLVNGRRFVSSNTASIFGPTATGLQVDLNDINTKLIDRVETIAIGGAPIYGSDAIAGTVNIILKRNYEGLDLDGQTGFSDSNDAQEYRLRALAGHNFLGGRANITVAGEYNTSKGLLYSDRAQTNQGNFYGPCPPSNTVNSQCLFPKLSYPALSQYGIPSVNYFAYVVNGAQAPYLGLQPGVLDANGNPLRFSPTGGSLVPINFGQIVGDPSAIFNQFSNGDYDINSTSQLLTDVKRYNVNALAQFQVTPNIRLFGEGWYAYSKGTNLRAQPIYNTALFGNPGDAAGPIMISVNNPYLTAAERSAIVNAINAPNVDCANINQSCSDQNYFGGNPFTGAPQDYFYLTRANTDIASGRASAATTVYRGVFGIDGNYHLGWRKWTFEAVANYGHSRTVGHSPEIAFQNFQNAVNATTDASGNIICTPGYTNSLAPTISSTCAPLNIFGNGQASQAAINYITAIAKPVGVNTQTVYTLSTSGPLFHLPGGDFGVAAGYEHRKETTDFNPGAFYQGQPNGDGTYTSYGQLVPIGAVTGGYHTNELFGEVRAPLVSPHNSIPAIYSLELHGAARYVEHSTAGKATTWTAEGRWGIIRDIALRANFTHAIRAPSITEIFNPSSTFFDFASDPCDYQNITQGPAPTTRAANCLAAGIPADFHATSDLASFLQSVSGNVALKNEASDAFSAGVILSPRFIPHLTVSADYLNIRLKNAISQFSGSQVVAACFDSPNFPDNQFCSRVTRDPGTHQINFIETSYFNAALFKYRGVIGALDYRTATPFLGAKSHFGINASYQHLMELTQAADVNSAPTHIGGGYGYPKDSAVVTLNYDNGPFATFLQANYTGKVRYDPDTDLNFYQYPTANAVVYLNSGFTYDIGKHATFRVAVDNVLNAQAPNPYQGGATSYFTGLLGRYYRFGIDLHM
ncbi:MAG: TonB-dependent receptor plug domain-containing protein [Pseudomonadota bacterium]